MRKIIAGLMCVFIPILLWGTGTFSSDRVTKVDPQSKSLSKIISGSDAPALQSNPTGVKGLGDLGKAPDYDQTIKRFREIIPGFDMYAATTLDPSWTGQYTTAKDQGSCGSCWAFATAGAMESKILIAGGPTYDLSEQELVSCACQYGCCGGYSTALNHWNNQGPMQESCAAYGDSGWSSSCSPPWLQASGTNCSTVQGWGCSRLRYYTTGYYTVDMSSTAEIKTSLYNDGPSYFRYDVYSDFNHPTTGFWYDHTTYPSGSVYTQTTGTYQGGHAVLIVGWSDTKSAWLCKNSWGATGGPQGDGTFWIAYSGHANDLNFGMANVQLATTNNTLWDQQIGCDHNVYVNQDFETAHNAYDVYMADDFTVSRPWSIETIYVPGDTWNNPCDLSNATTLNFMIYNDNSGVPDGDPSGGGNSPLWSLSVAPTDSQITLSAGEGGYDTNVTVDLNTPVELEPGTYWLVFYPELNFDSYGQSGRYVSCTTNGYDAQVINPGGGMSLPTSWTSIQDPSAHETDEQDLAFRLDGTAAGGFNPGIGILLLGN